MSEGRDNIEVQIEIESSRRMGKALKKSIYSDW